MFCANSWSIKFSNSSYCFWLINGSPPDIWISFISGACSLKFFHKSVFSYQSNGFHFTGCGTLPVSILEIQPPPAFVLPFSFISFILLIYHYIGNLLIYTNNSIDCLKYIPYIKNWLVKYIVALIAQLVEQLICNQ